jgi:hypothetical protein
LAQIIEQHRIGGMAQINPALLAVGQLDPAQRLHGMVGLVAKIARQGARHDFRLQGGVNEHMVADDVHAGSVG